jgi:hypothetical protein
MRGYVNIWIDTNGLDSIFRHGKVKMEDTAKEAMERFRKRGVFQWFLDIGGYGHSSTWLVSFVRIEIIKERERSCY